MSRGPSGAPLAAALALAALTGCAAGAAGTPFACEDGTAGRAVTTRQGIAVYYSPGPVGGPAVETMVPAASQGGPRYTGLAGSEWLGQGAGALFTPPGGARTACTLGGPRSPRL